MLSLLLAGGLQAQEASPDELDKLKDLSIEELATVKVETVYGASQHEQKVTEAPSSISLVTADDIKKQGYRTLADILNSVNGFFVSDDRNYGYIGLRGFNRPGDYGGRVLILVDGQRLNEPLLDSAFNMTDFILDVDLIQRVEVIRGPGSSLYGDNAFFAVINVVTRRGADVGGVETSGAYGAAPAPAITLDPPGPAPAPEARRILRILLAEDHPTDQLLALEILKKMGFVAEVAANGREALEAGADDYVTKPFDRDELRARVQVGCRVLELQRKLRDRERLEGVLQTARTVCHEMNQPLQTVLGYSELLLAGLSATDPKHDLLVAIKRGTERLGQVTRRVMQITHAHTKTYLGDPRPIDELAGKAS